MGSCSDVKWNPMSNRLCGAWQWYQNNQDNTVVYDRHSITVPEGFATTLLAPEGQIPLSLSGMSNFSIASYF